MTYEVDVRGRRRSVEVSRAGGDWRVTLDGRDVAVSVRQIGDTWSLLIEEGPPKGGPYDPNVGAGFSRPMKSYEVLVGGRTNGERLVHVNGYAVPVSMLDPRERLVRRSTGGVHVGAGPRSIVAPMPGRIVKVLVKAGDQVAAHQGLVVVEAMKMENELRAPAAGTVTDVRVKDGMSVEARAILIVLES